MGGWTMILRAALASALACFSLAASLNSPTSDDDAAADRPVVASVTDEGAPAISSVVETISDAVAAAAGCETVCKAAGCDQPTTGASRSGLVQAHVSDEPIDPTAEAVARYRELQGSVLDASPTLRAGEVAGEFAAALARIVGEQPPAELAHATEEQSAEPKATVANASGSDSLRIAARQLELRAAEAEDLHHFADADHFRDLAMAIRREARRWDESGSAGSPQR